MIILGTTCAVKIKNSIITKATINGSDLFRLLDARYSEIKEMYCSVSFNSIPSHEQYIVNPIMNLISSKLTVNGIDISELSNNTIPLIESSEHSSTFFSGMIHHANFPYASPEWTDNDAVSPTYGNNMSYNILVFPYIPPTVGWTQTKTSSSTMDVTMHVTGMGDATTVNMVVEWSETGADSWNLADPVSIDATETGDYVFDVDFLSCGQYDLRATIQDTDEGYSDVLTEIDMAEMICVYVPFVVSWSHEKITDSTADITVTVESMGDATEISLDLHWSDTGENNWQDVVPQTPYLATTTGDYVWTANFGSCGNYDLLLTAQDRNVNPFYTWYEQLDDVEEMWC